jgi:hypothetical protein
MGAKEGGAMNTAYVVKGTLTDGRTVTLDEPVSLPGARVRIVIEPDPDVRLPTGTMADFVAQLLESQRTHPRVPLSSAEIRALMHGDPMQDYEE